MKNLFRKISFGWLLLFVATLVLSVFGIVDAGAMCADAVATGAGGYTNVNSIESATEGRQLSPDLLLDEVYEKVTKIRPYDTPLYTIASRPASTRSANREIVRYYTTDVLPLTAKVQTAFAGGVTSGSLITTDNDIFAANQTISVHGVNGTDSQGNPDPTHPLQLYVVNKDSSGNPIVVTANGTGSDRRTIPPIPVQDGSGNDIILERLGRGASEAQFKTDPYAVYPTWDEQYLQSFITQVEMTDIFKRADKEVNWSFSDEVEEAMFDMKRTANSTFWKGVKGRLTVANKHREKAEDTYFTEGVWYQAGTDFAFASSGISISEMGRLYNAAFTGTSASKQKLFIVGSEIIRGLEAIPDYNRIIREGTKKQNLGLELSMLYSTLGTLALAHDPSFDDMGWANKGFILDPDLLVKYKMPSISKTKDNKDLMEARSTSGVYMEISGLILRNPKAHLRVTL